MMIATLRTCALALLAAALASCGDSGKNDGKQASSASSEILPGTISDDMIPYDTLRSEPPPAKIALEGAGGANGGATPTAVASGETSSETPAQSDAPGAAKRED